MKCKLACRGVLKGVKVALCGSKCVNLHEDTIKIHYSYYNQHGNDKNFKKYIAKIENVLRL